MPGTMCRKPGLIFLSVWAGRARADPAGDARQREKPMIRLFARCVAFCALFAAISVHAQEAPDALVRKTVDEVLATIKQTKDQKKLQELAEARVVPYFDFRQMTQLAAGRSWSTASAAQQEALEKAFRSLLVRTYT